MGLFDVLFTGAASGSPSQFTRADRAQLIRLENKIDLIMKHLGLQYYEETPRCRLSPEVQMLARDPSQKIQAIKLHREQTGLGLKDAKDEVEEFMNFGR